MAGGGKVPAIGGVGFIQGNGAYAGSGISPGKLVLMPGDGTSLGIERVPKVCPGEGAILAGQCKPPKKLLMFGHGDRLSYRDGSGLENTVEVYGLMKFCPCPIVCPLLNVFDGETSPSSTRAVSRVVPLLLSVADGGTPRSQKERKSRARGLRMFSHTAAWFWCSVVLEFACFSSCALLDIDPYPESADNASLTLMRSSALQVCS